MDQIETWSTPTDEILIRRGVIGDVPFVTNSWLTSFRKSAYTWGVGNSEYNAFHHKLLEALVPQSMLVVLCNRNNPDQILGWAVYQKLEGDVLVLHYVYIKFAFRRNGFARCLVDEIMDHERPRAVIWTHRTEIGAKIQKNLPELSSWRLNPYLMYTLAASYKPNWAL